ncbi:MAG: cystathionine gamma-synthase family protein [Armatimonadetes bacterium]|nr:cystathionine gamma-synthase family protein [Armatimonadota bacterium]
MSGFDPKHQFQPESLMMSYGYKPSLSEGSLKPPLFLTSTFVFKTAEEGKRFFEIAYGKAEAAPGEELGLIYSRLNNPDLEILEERLALWDGAEMSAVFESGMAAISTCMLEFLRPGDVLLHSAPVYGGTHHFIHHVLNQYGIEVVEFFADQDAEEVCQIAAQKGVLERVKVVYIETPANPTNALLNLTEFANLAKRLNAISIVDNTYMGPMWQKPLKHGIDLVLYSATKYLGGHSDLIAGSVSGNATLMARVKAMRTFLGNMASPHTGWMLMRSLETLKVRTDRQALNAKKVADFLADHPLVEKVHYLGHLNPGDVGYETYREQCSCGGAMVSFDIVRGEKAAFRFLNALKLMHLAVSLGGTESLAQHPATMTHCDIPEDEQARMSISPKLIRISIGVEDPDDLIADICQAFDEV